VNAFALGLVRKDEIFYAKATGVGNPVIYVGAKTGRDGIHGATMASEEFTEGSEQKRPNVQMGDPFMEKLLLEACLEAMSLKPGAVLGIQDMGAAGLTCSTCEMGARGELGVSIELDKVPQRETGMTSYEIMLSESQERMLLVAEKGREGEVQAVFAKWGLDASIVGVVTADDVMRVTHHGELMAEIPNKALTDDAPVYQRPVGEWKCPAPLDPPAWVLEELKKPRDYTADLKRLLASANICDKRWVFEQYDSMVQTNTVEGPGGEAGVMRVKNSCELSVVSGELETKAGGSLTTHNSQLTTKPQRGIAMALAGNGRWAWLDPKLGAMHAVAEAARKVACTGATPVAATNCLNFGNPEKPEIMAQLSAAIDGIAEACTALGTPITGGNVSLYNETKGEGIYPTPVIGVVGLLEDVSKAVPAAFQNVGDYVIVALFNQQSADWRRELGSSEFIRSIGCDMYGTLPLINLDSATYCILMLQDLAESGLVNSMTDVGSGGVAVALAKASLAGNIGVDVGLWSDGGDESAAEAFFGERIGSIIITCSGNANYDAVIRRIEQDSSHYVVLPIGKTVPDRFQLEWEREPVISLPLGELRPSYSQTLESQLAAEVVTA
jgi:phosphoribosylformylglycinamidine synthase